MAGRAFVALAMATISAGARIQRKNDPRALNSCGIKGASTPSSQIVNGEDATECEWRWQAQLRRGSFPFCGASLITPEWVLTAAHCVSSSNFDVVVGDHNKSDTSANEQRRSAARVVKHPGYASNPTRNDFALVKLDSPVTINDCVGTVCLPTPGNDVADGSTCWITGWGTLRSGGSSPQILQEAYVGIVSNDDCVNEFGYSPGQIDDSMLCAQGRLPDGRITDACQGDSGGPLVCENNGQWTVYGATSWGYGCAGENYPGVWARVHTEVDWIDEVLNAPTPAPTPAPPPGTWVLDGSGCEMEGNCIQSLNHPSNYGNNQQCSIHLYGDIPLRFDAFRTESRYDVLNIGGKGYSGSSAPPNGAYSGRVTWASDFSVTATGWKMCRTD